jgi:hypothetical protein
MILFVFLVLNFSQVLKEKILKVVKPDLSILVQIQTLQDDPLIGLVDFLKSKSFDHFHQEVQIDLSLVILVKELKDGSDWVERYFLVLLKDRVKLLGSDLGLVVGQQVNLGDWNVGYQHWDLLFEIVKQDPFPVRTRVDHLEDLLDVSESDLERLACFLLLWQSEVEKARGFKLFNRGDCFHGILLDLLEEVFVLKSLQNCLCFLDIFWI